MVAGDDDQLVANAVAAFKIALTVKDRPAVLPVTDVIDTASCAQVEGLDEERKYFVVKEHAGNRCGTRHDAIGRVRLLITGSPRIHTVIVPLRVVIQIASGATRARVTSHWLPLSVSPADTKYAMSALCQISERQRMESWPSR